jgi:hypothetical protein
MKVLYRIIAILIVAFGPAVIAAEQHIDASRVVDQATAESILGEPVKVATPRNMDGNDGYYSKCNYYTAKPGKTLIIRVYQAVLGVDAQAALQGVSESTGAMTMISGLGDRARLSSGADSGLPPHVMMLYVVKSNVLITVGISGFDDDALAQEKAKTVAQKLLASL